MEYETSSGDANGAVDLVLADLTAISLLIESPTGDVAAAQARPGRREPTHTKSRRCTCGKCRACIDNARWDSVFQQKFADPDYYSLRQPKQGSSLNGF